MDKVQFLKQLSKKELKDLAFNMGLTYRTNGFRTGFSVKLIHSNDGEGYVSASSWDHDYSSSKDYDDDYIQFNDHEVMIGRGEDVLIDSLKKRFPQYKGVHAQYIIEKIKAKEKSLAEQTSKETAQIDAMKKEVELWASDSDEMTTN